MGKKESRKQRSGVSKNDTRRIEIKRNSGAEGSILLRVIEGVIRQGGG